MKDSDKIKNFLIDEFYNETHEKEEKTIEHIDEYKEFKNKLNSTSKKMDMLNEDIFDFKIDTLSIIEHGECLRESRKCNKEIIMFILLSTIILLLYATAILRINTNILIISQILIVILTPWIIIPAVAIKRRVGDV